MIFRYTGGNSIKSVLKYTLKIGFDLKGLFFILDIIRCPISEIIYRLSVKRW